MKRAIQTHASPAASRQDVERGFWEDVREIVAPANKWHYVFPSVVVAVALAYWIGSLIFLKASWAEIVMYRPGGDNQVWPVVTALSHFNFGDPTDALKYGQGVGGFHAVILLPYAFAFAIFGAPGYMIADAVFSWCYFVAAAMLFRRWGLGLLSSLVFSTALSTSSLQSVLHKIGLGFAKFIGLFGLAVSEWDFPDLFNLSVASKRLPRPFLTEILLVLIFYLLVRLWQERRAPSLKQGLVLGALAALLMQGDPFSFVALGLFVLIVIVRIDYLQKWKVCWGFIAGVAGGGALVGWYFVVQMLTQNADGAVRFGMANYPRNKILFLPGYAPWLRVFLIICFAFLIRTLVFRRQTGKPSKTNAQHGSTASAGRNAPAPDLNVNTSLALFAVALVISAWLAQPLQLLLLGKGAQIYHYFIYTMPTFYTYAFFLVVIRLFMVLNHSESPVHETAPAFSRGATGVTCGFLLVLMFVAGVEDPTDVIRSRGVSRRDVSPWVALGDSFRPNLRKLDKEFRENPALKNSRSFATFCQEVNFLLTAFHEKRAFLPDNGFTTLSDRELEQRLFELCKICQIKPEVFANIIQDPYTMNYWLGCAKYWCASDHKFAPESDYFAQNIAEVRKMPLQSPFTLIMPRSEFRRLTEGYNTVLAQPSDSRDYPDTIIQTVILQENGITVDRRFYQKTYTNDVFTVYTRIPNT